MTDIQKLSCYDSRIFQERPLFAVNKGALSITNSPFSAISATSSQMSFNIQVPSLNVFLDREVLWTSGCNMSMTVTVANINTAAPLPGGLVNQPVVNFGSDIALSPFPLNSLLSTLSATINDTVTTINSQDVLYELLRLTNQKNNRLQRTCPTMLDKYLSYNDAVGAINNPLSSYFDGSDYDNMPNGAFYNIQFCDLTGAVLTGAGTYADGVDTIAYTNGVPQLGNDAGGNAKATYAIYFRFTSTEKLVLSPFIFNDEVADEEVGLYGINNIQMVMNFANASRIVRNAPLANAGNNKTVSNVAFLGNSPFISPRMNVMFLTPNLSISLPPKSIVPYFEFPRYISTPGTAITAGASASLTSQTITLPQIPDYLLIYCKPQSYVNTEGDFYFPINNFSLNFDNFSGLMSSHTKEQLYDIAVKNGLDMDWNSWSGQGRAPLLSVAAPNSASNAGNINLVGGFLLIKPGTDFALQSGQAPSVVGNYTLQFNITCENRSEVTRTPIIYVVAFNSGYFVSQSGSSAIIKGVLNESDVINAPMADATTRGSIKRLVGGSFWSKLGNALGKVKNFLLKPEVRKVVKGLTSELGGDEGKRAVDLASKLGYGARSGAAMAGAGRRRRDANLAELF